MNADTTPAAMEVARFEIEQVGAIGTMEDGTETITMGVLLSGDVAAIKWAGTHIFSSAVLMRAIDHAALAAELSTARAERDEARKEVERLQSDRPFIIGANHGYETAMEQVAAEARRYAGHYEDASDGRNTFVLFAEWAARLTTEPLGLNVTADDFGGAE